MSRDLDPEGDYTPLPVAEVVEQLLARLREVKDKESKAMFARVELYDLSDLSKALEELYIGESAAAILLVETVKHTPTIKGRRLQLDRAFLCSVLVTVKHYGTRSEAALQVLTMGEAAMRATLGQVTADLICVPENGELFGLGKEANNQPDRICYRLPLLVQPRRYFGEELDRGARFPSR